MNDIKQLMMTALEGPYVCHEDVPEETPASFDTHFTVCGEDDSEVYLVCIQKVNIK